MQPSCQTLSTVVLRVDTLGKREKLSCFGMGGMSHGALQPNIETAQLSCTQRFTQVQDRGGGSSGATLDIAASQQVALVAYAPQATIFDTAPISGLAETITIPAIRCRCPLSQLLSQPLTGAGCQASHGAA